MNDFDLNIIGIILHDFFISCLLHTTLFVRFIKLLNILIYSFSLLYIIPKYEYTKLSILLLMHILVFSLFWKKPASPSGSLEGSHQKDLPNWYSSVKWGKNKSLVHYITDALDVLITIEEPILPWIILLIIKIHYHKEILDFCGFAESFSKHSRKQKPPV